MIKCLSVLRLSGNRKISGCGASVRLVAFTRDQRFPSDGNGGGGSRGRQDGVRSEGVGCDVTVVTRSHERMTR